MNKKLKSFIIAKHLIKPKDKIYFHIESISDFYYIVYSYSDLKHLEGL